MKQWKLTDLLSLVVFGIFAICILLVLLTGAGVYRNLVARGGEDYQRRTAAQYITTRVHQADTHGGIAVEDFGGRDALVLREEIRGRTYLTRVYCRDGFLRELFTAGNGSVSPEDGEKILEVRELSLSLEKGMLTARITLPDGSVEDLILYLRSGEVAAP